MMRARRRWSLLLLCAAPFLWTGSVAVAEPAATAAHETVRPMRIQVPRVVIYPGDLIAEGLLTEQDFKGSPEQLAAVHVSRDMLVGNVARRTLIPGHPIPLDAVRAPVAVQQGQPITVTYAQDQISITFTGTTLQAGAVGETISVRNTDTGRTVKAKVLTDLTAVVAAQ